jgi:hypothetical protein
MANFNAISQDTKDYYPVKISMAVISLKITYETYVLMEGDPV